MIKNVIFDIGNVLVDFRWLNYMRDLGFNEKEIEILSEHMILGPLWTKLDCGLIEEEDVIASMIEKTPEYENQIRRFWDGIIDVIEEYPHTVEWIKDLKNRGTVHLKILLAQELLQLILK